MNFTDDDMKEFSAEALELLDHAENALLKLDAGADLSSQYDILFRSYHNLKGASGMLGFLKLQTHVHGMETVLLSQKNNIKLDRSFIDLLLRGQDVAKRILNGEEVTFSFEISMPKTITQAFQEAREPLPPVGAVVTDRVDQSKKRGGKPVNSLVERVLVLDDDQDIVTLLLSILSSEGIECKGITDSRTAMQTIESFKPTVLFSDIDMPYLDGIGVLKQVKKDHPRLPVVFVSGRIDKAVLMHAIQHGVYSVIEKPFDLNEVVQAVRNASRQNHLLNLAHSSLNLILYQYADLDAFLLSKGDDQVRRSIRNELALLIDLQKKLLL